MLLYKLLRMRYKLTRLNQVDHAGFETIDDLVELLLEIDYQFGKIPEDDYFKLDRHLRYVKGAAVSASERTLLITLLDQPDTECRKGSQGSGVHL